MDKQRLQELAGVQHLEEAVGTLSKKDIAFIADLIDEQLSDAEAGQVDYIVSLVQILGKLGLKTRATAWQTTLRHEGIIKKDEVIVK